MKPSAQTRSLATLAGLREREVQRLQADVAVRQAERVRYRANLDRMAGLVAGSSDCGPVATLSVNFSHYKQHLLQLADTHRVDLALHEADMAVTQHALALASQKQEALGQVLVQRQQQTQRAAQQRDQKRADELASQVWARGAL